MTYDNWSCDLLCAASSPDLYRINLEQVRFVKSKLVFGSSPMLMICEIWLSLLREDFSLRSPLNPRRWMLFLEGLYKHWHHCFNCTVSDYCCLRLSTMYLFCHSSNLHGLVACGGEDGAVECFDMRMKSSAARINAVTHGGDAASVLLLNICSIFR